MPQAKTLPLILVEEGGLGAAGLDSHQRKWAAANGFTGKLGKLLPLPDAAGNLSGYVFGLGAKTGGPVLATGIAAAMLDPANTGSKVPSPIPPTRRSASGSAATASIATNRVAPRPIWCCPRGPMRPKWGG